MAAARASKSAKAVASKTGGRGRPHAAAPPDATASITPIRVLIADGHPLFLDGLEAFCRSQKDLTIVARCGDGDEALREIRGLRPDVALVDGQLPSVNALGIVRRLEKDHLPTKVVLFISEDEHDVMIEAVGSGIRGFLHKSIPSRLIGECIRKIHAGGYWLEKSVTAAAMEKMVRRESGHRRLIEGGLTPREIEIAKLAAHDLRTEDISNKLNISPGTAKLHLHQIYRKLNLSGRIALMLYARENGLA
jgi:two-component system, NarL family, nitrate/nitrite response regulator NarL